MSNKYSLISDDKIPDLYRVEIGGKTLGQVAFVDDGWRYRIDSEAVWSSISFGSEFEAAEFVFVDRGILEINSNGLVVSKIKIQR